MDFRHLNVLGRRFDYRRTWAKRKAKVAALLKGADVATAVECYPADQADLDKLTGFLSVGHLGSAVVYEPTRYGLNRSWSLTWLGTTHGAIIAELVDRKTGKTFNVCASHLPPFAWRQKRREQCMRELADFMAGWHDPTIIGTDANWRGMEPYAARLGYPSARKGPEMTTTGAVRPGRAIDYVLVARGVTTGSWRVVSGAGATDHNLIEATLTVGGVSTL